MFFVCLTDYGSVLVTFNGDRGKQGENGFFTRESDEDFKYLYIFHWVDEFQEKG